MRKPKVALALGGGTARGLAHIGVIKVLVEKKVPIDFITGTSIGAIVGSFYAKNLDVFEVERFALENGNKRIVELLDPSFRFGLIRGRKIERFLKKHLGEISFKDLKIPLITVCSDLGSGESVYFSRGDLIKAIRASISIPLVFSPVEHHGRVLVDGHLSEPVPVSAAINHGADVVIAVNLDYKKKLKSDVSALSFRQVANRSTKILLYQLSKSNAEKADVVIAPDIDFYKFADFSSAKNYIEKGEVAARQAMPEIKKVLRKHGVKL